MSMHDMFGKVDDPITEAARLPANMMPNDQGKGQTPQADVPLDPPVGREGD